MLSAQLLTIGTEITSGEVVNSNASWLSLRLEELGVRVLAHLSVRDHKQEILSALRHLDDSELIFVTGGLGPTSDDVTRECMALFTHDKLEFDVQVWNALEAMYLKRQLPLREAHKWQCQFPTSSVRLKNSVGTALGFYQEFNGRHYFVLPGPPRELEGMWFEEVRARVEKLLPVNSYEWIRWTCLGAPESEVAELVEPLLKDSGIEVGYRAQVPYVKVKIYADRLKDAAIVERISAALKPWLVGSGLDDLAAELLRLWPADGLIVVDELTDARFAQRLFEQKQDAVTIEYHTNTAARGGGAGRSEISIRADGEEFVVSVKAGDVSFEERKALPFKLALNSERGKRSVTEWALWLIVKNLRARA